MDPVTRKHIYVFACNRLQILAPPRNLPTLAAGRCPQSLRLSVFTFPRLHVSTSTGLTFRPSVYFIQVFDVDLICNICQY